MSDECIKIFKDLLEDFPPVESHCEGIGFFDSEPTYRHGRDPDKIESWLKRANETVRILEESKT